MLCRVWEKQGRGLLHVHPVVACAAPRRQAAAEHYPDRLKAWAREYGFGFVSRKFRPQPARAATAYLSAYLCHGKREKMTFASRSRRRTCRALWLCPTRLQRC
jgi:hypothetical protein